MPAQGIYQLLDLGGGVNQGLPPTQIAERESPDMLNLYPYGPSLKRRPGIRRETASYGSELTTIGRYHDASSGQSVLIVASKSGVLASYSGGSWTTLYDSGLASYRPWTLLQYNRVGLFCRPGLDTIRWWRPSFAANATYKLRPGTGTAGIEAPATAPTLSDGGAGALELSGDYTAVCTFYDPDTGAESDPSPASSALTLAALHQIDWSSIPASTNPRVEHVRLYRSLADMPGAYYYVGYVENGTTTYASEATNVDDMGSAVSFRNGVPPSGIVAMALHREHLFATNGIDLYFSEPGLPESFHALSFLRCGPDDGGLIVALLSTPDRLLVLKTNGVWYVSGDDRGSWEVHRLSDGHGCAAAASAAWSNGLAFWLGDGGREIWATDGGVPVAIGTPQIKTFLDQVSPEYLDRVVSFVYEPLGWFGISFPDTARDPDDWDEAKQTWIYDIRARVWFPWRWDASSIAGSATYRSLRGVLSYTDTDGTVKLLGTLAGLTYVYDLMTGTGLDESAPSHEDEVNWSWTTKRLVGQDAHGALQAVRRVSFLADWTPPDEFDLNSLDEAGASKAFRVVTPQPDIEWQAFNLADVHEPRPSVQLKLSGRSSHQFELRGIQIETLQHTRRRRAA